MLKKNTNMKIKKFNENITSKLDKVWYIPVNDLRKASNEEVEEWMDNHPHNNGYAFWWEILDPNDDAAYPKIEQYFLDNGLKVGDAVLVHSEW
mgnify:FL=1